MKPSQLLVGAARAASYNMMLQLTTRVLTFVLNAFILRYISYELLGVVNVRLTLLYSTSIFITREAFNRACLSHVGKASWTQIINLLWLTVPFSVVVCCILSFVWISLLQRPDPSIIPYYDFGATCFALSTVIEVLAQPLWVIGQAFMFVKLRVLMDSFLLAMKSVITVFLILYKPQLGLVIFSLAQVISMCGYVTAYYVYFTFYMKSARKKNDDFPLKSIRDFFPKFIKNKSFINFDLALLTWTFMKQSLLKQFLTEGEKYVMTLFKVLSFADQGIYDIVHNLGSLAARFIFCPLEESGYLFFSQLLERGQPLKKQRKESSILAHKILSALLKTVTLIGLTILVYGYSYSFLALDIYGGSALSASSGPTLLRWYSLYVLVIAMNGVTECFVFATMSHKELDRCNVKMLLFSVIFLAASWILIQMFGSVGFILANCLNMLLRIANSVSFLWFYFSEISNHPMRALLLRPEIFASFAFTFTITCISESMFCCDQGLWRRAVHVGVGAICLLTNLLVVWFFEKDWIDLIRKLYLHQKHKNQQPKVTETKQKRTKKSPYQKRKKIKAIDDSFIPLYDKK